QRQRNPDGNEQDQQDDERLLARPLNNKRRPEWNQNHEPKQEKIEENEAGVEVHDTSEHTPVKIPVCAHGQEAEGITKQGSPLGPPQRQVREIPARWRAKLDDQECDDDREDAIGEEDEALQVVG